MATLSTLRSLLEDEFGESYPITSGTMDAMSATTTLEDAARAESDDHFNNCWLYLAAASGTAAPHGEERLITAFKSTSTITVEPGFTSSAGDTYTYEIRRKATRRAYNGAVNTAIRRGRGAFLEVITDETSMIIYQDQQEYDLPSGCKRVLSLELERTDVDDTGTATSALSTTLSDTNKSWDTDEWNDYYAVVIYDGTGQGQQRTITNTTSDTLTVAEWTTTPDTTSKYKIKYIGQEKQRWQPILEWGYSTNYSSGTPTLSVHFDEQHDVGMAVRIQYLKDAPELSSDTDNTSMPDEYVKNEGMAALLQQHTTKLPGRQSEDIHIVIAGYKAEAQRIKNNQGYRTPPIKIRQVPGGGITYPDDWPFKRR